MIEIANNEINIASDDVYLGAEWYEPALVEFANHEIGFPEDYTAMAVGGVTIPISDPDGVLAGAVADHSVEGAQVVLTVVLTLENADGSTSTITDTVRMHVASAELGRRLVNLELAALEAAKLEKLFPGRLISTDLFPEALEEGLGKPVPYAYGTAIKCPCFLVETNSGAGPWIYSAAYGATAPTLETLYANRVIVDSDIYSTQSGWQADAYDTDTAGWSDDSVGTGTATKTGSPEYWELSSGTGSDVGAVSLDVSVQSGENYQLQVDVPAGLTDDLTVDADGQTVVISPGNTGTVDFTASGSTVTLSFSTTGASETTGFDAARLILWPDALFVSFDQSPLDFDGAYYQLEADVTGTSDNECSQVISDLLTYCGLTPDSTSFAAAITEDATNKALADFAFGRDGQRTCAAWIDELLKPARATYFRNSSGDYEIIQKRSGSSSLTLNEDQGDEIEVSSVTYMARPNTRAVALRPSVREPREMSVLLRRGVDGGTLGDESPLQVELMRNGEGGDRLLDFRRKEAEFNAILKARIYFQDLSTGDIITVTSAAFELDAEDFRVIKRRHIVGGYDIEAHQYDSSIHTYEAGSIPSDATTGYTADYSQTPPAAPTSLTTDDEGATLDAQGNATYWFEFSATPPSVNWKVLVFEVYQVLNDDSEVFLKSGEGASVGGGKHGVRIGQLPTNVPLTVYCYARNAFGVKGATTSLDETSQTSTGAPSAPSSVTISDIGSATQVSVSFTAASDHAGFEYQVNVDGGGYTSGPYFTSSNPFNTTNIWIISIRVRVRCKDTQGLTSGWTESNELT